MEIKIAKTQEELNEIYSLRYTIYIEELGKTFLSHNKEKKMLKDNLDDNAFQVGIYDKNRLIGMYRLRYPVPGDSDINNLGLPFEIQKKYKISIQSRMMLRKEVRNSSAFFRLMLYNFDKNLRDRVHFGFLEVEQHLLEMYKKFGFHEIGPIINEYNQERILLFMNPMDYVHLKNTGSRFADLFTKYIEDINKDVLIIQKK